MHFIKKAEKHKISEARSYCDFCFYVLLGNVHGIGSTNHNYSLWMKSSFDSLLDLESEPSLE